MAIAIKTYFQKIADPADFAGTASVPYHQSYCCGGATSGIWPVVVDLTCGSVFMRHGGNFFITGLNVPRHPEQGQEVVMVIAVLSAKPRSNFYGGCIYRYFDYWAGLLAGDCANCAFCRRDFGETNESFGMETSS